MPSQLPFGRRELGMINPDVRDAIAKLIQELAASSDTNWSFGSHVRPDGGTHALDEMQADGIEFADMLYVLKRCNVVKTEFVRKYNEYRFRAIGSNVDGVRMTFIVTLWESTKTIEIVTAWADR